MNSPAFFSAIRDPLFGGSMTQSQVKGLTAILDAWAKDFLSTTSLTQLAYCLGTAYHETARSMQPIDEHGNTAYFTKLYDIKGSNPRLAKELGNVKAGDGALFHGRGFVQLTGRANYAKATKKLQKLGILAANDNLETNPELVKRLDVAVAILFVGMEEGWFTGGKLDKYIDDQIDGDEHKDFVTARKIINGTDCNEKIAGYADRFLVALQKAA